MTTTANSATIKNKEFLWNMMSRDDFFVGINGTQFVADVKNDFETIVNEVSGDTKWSSSLTESNKEILRRMWTNLLKYKSVQNMPATLTTPLSTKSALEQERNGQFQRDLNSRQNEFESLINRSLPPKIDFSDGLQNENSNNNINNNNNNNNNKNNKLRCDWFK